MQTCPKFRQFRGDGFIHGLETIVVEGNYPLPDLRYRVVPVFDGKTSSEVA